MEAAKKASEGGDMSAVTKIAEKQQKETQKRLDPYSPTSFSTGKIAMMLPFHQPLLQGFCQCAATGVTHAWVCRSFVGEIYNQFVSPKSPGVDPETARAIVKEFLTACQKHMPLLAKQSMDMGMKFGSMMQGENADPKLLETMASQMNTFMPQVTKTMQAVIRELLNRSDSMADDIFEAMDDDKDGIVTKKQFDKNFLASMQQIVNMQALAQTAQKVMESISPQDLQALSQMIDPELLKGLQEQMGNMDPEMMMQQLKQVTADPLHSAVLSTLDAMPKRKLRKLTRGPATALQMGGALPGMGGMGGMGGGRKGRLGGFGR